MYNNSRTVAVISYITWVGWIIAFLIRDKTDAFVAHHMNQALMINLLKIAGALCASLPHVGHSISTVVGVGAFVLIIMGIYRAAHWNSDPLPIIGEIHLIG